MMRKKRTNESRNNEGPHKKERPFEKCVPLPREWKKGSSSKFGKHVTEAKANNLCLCCCCCCCWPYLLAPFNLRGNAPEHGFETEVGKATWKEENERLRKNALIVSKESVSFWPIPTPLIELWNVWLFSLVVLSILSACRQITENFYCFFIRCENKNCIARFRCHSIATFAEVRRSETSLR